jgi:hypothetical protein
LVAGEELGEALLSLRDIYLRLPAVSPQDQSAFQNAFLATSWHGKLPSNPARQTLFRMEISVLAFRLPDARKKNGNSSVRAITPVA